MSPRAKAYDLPSAHRHQKNRRRARRAVNEALTKETTAVKKDRKTELFDRLEAQHIEHSRFEMDREPKDAGTAAVEAGEQRYQEQMTGENAPEWARPVVKPAVAVAPVGTREDITNALARLDAEQADLRKKLEKSMEEQRAILNAQLEEQARAEKQIEVARALPNRLHDVLAEVRSFREAEAAPIVEVDDPIARGKAALDRALRRSRGEDVPEPEYTPPAQRVPQESTLQAQLKAKIAPALADSSARKDEIAKWSAAFGKVFDDLYVAKDDSSPREQELITVLMRGLPPTQANLAVVTGLLHSVRSALDMKSTMEKTIDEQTRALARLVERADSRGPMTVQGDHSSEFYDVQRELAVALHDLATVTTDGVETLWVSAKEVERRLSVIAEIRAQLGGAPQEPLTWTTKNPSQEPPKGGYEGVEYGEGWSGLTGGKR